ncbi:MAG: hypothetical protein VX820_00805 [Candidatus Neomarinimicrobiota bacterium]|nr:hypothetical protein [Candidatus Neomarinimicrobiota bacterium]|tara:strand:- start:2121 stop:2489 length:369 start_codon:yes stop_codon:yes gene_type:complete
MPDLPEIVDEKQVINPSSKLDEEKKVFIEDLVNILDEIGKNYGPFLMKELLQRLERVIKNFDEEFMTLVKDSFEKWKIKDMQLREMMSREIIQKKKENNQDNKSIKSPDFIKDVKFGPVHAK